jgi:hypothetical protein
MDRFLLILLCLTTTSAKFTPIAVDEPKLDKSIFAAELKKDEEINSLSEATDESNNKGTSTTTHTPNALKLLMSPNFNKIKQKDDQEKATETFDDAQFHLSMKQMKEKEKETQQKMLGLRRL